MITRLITRAATKLLEKRNKRLSDWLALFIRNGDIKGVKYCVRKGADVNADDVFGITPLMRAALKGRLDMVELLIEKGALIDKTNIRQRGLTPLMHAASKGHLDIAKLLIGKGSDIHQENKHGQTVFTFASSGGNLNLIKFLIEKGADINAVDRRGAHSIMHAASGGSLNAIKFLIEKGVNVHATNNSDRTALMEAASKGHLNTVKFLVEKKGANINATDDRWTTPLMFAVVTLRDYTGNPVMVSEKKRLDVVKFLVEKGAKINATDDEGKTPLMLAVENLGDYKGNPLMRQWAAFSNKRLDAVKFLVENGADVNVANDKGITPLMLGVEVGHFDGVEFLLENGARVNEADKRGQTALMRAASKEKGYLEIIKLLLKNGANVNAKDKRGCTPFMFAIKGGHNGVADLLLKKGADICAKDDLGRTASALRSTPDYYIEFLKEKEVKAGKSFCGGGQFTVDEKQTTAETTLGSINSNFDKKGR